MEHSCETYPCLRFLKLGVFFLLSSLPTLNTYFPLFSSTHDISIPFSFPVSYVIFYSLKQLFLIFQQLSHTALTLFEGRGEVMRGKVFCRVGEENFVDHIRFVFFTSAALRFVLVVLMNRTTQRLLRREFVASL